ncbi:unnamed protein product [Urochloa humidicola]
MAASAACAGFFFDPEPLGDCARPLGRDSDIFMYRGDTPFCSEECRHEQMQLDAIRTRRAARSAGRRQQQYSSSGTDSPRRGQESRKVSVES